MSLCTAPIRPIAQSASGVRRPPSMVICGFVIGALFSADSLTPWLLQLVLRTVIAANTIIAIFFILIHFAVCKSNAPGWCFVLYTFAPAKVQQKIRICKLCLHKSAFRRIFSVISEQMHFIFAVLFCCFYQFIFSRKR